MGKENNSNVELASRSKAIVPKKSMDASALLAKTQTHGRGRGIQSLSGDDGATPFRRKASDMKYSSVSPPEKRCPSARTISNSCFPGASSTSSSSPESLLVDSCESSETSPDSRLRAEMESIVDSSPIPKNKEPVSPDSRLRAEMESIVDSSPIPKSYLSSPPKKSPVMPEIRLNKAGVAKKSLAASDLLRKTGRNAKGPSASTKAQPTRNGSVPRKLSTADSCQKRKNGRPGRATSTAPNGGSKGLAKSSEWDKPAKSKKQPLALSVQREKQQRKERAREAKQDGKNEISSRRNLDKRTARLRFGDAFKADIAEHRERMPHLNNGTNHADKDSGAVQSRGTNGVSIAVRKRPIFEYERDRGDYDIVSVDSTTHSVHDVCTIHNCLMHPDMKQMLLKPTHFPVTAAFDQHADEDAVFKHIAEPLVLDAAHDGVSTILMFGQTGAGKSHTMSGIETRAAEGLFQTLDSKFADTPESERPVVTIQFVELAGKECRDLLVKRQPKDGVKLKDVEDGSVRLVNAASVEVTCPEEIMARISLAKGRRATEATDKNGVSSRSHAVCQIQITGKNKKGRGVLTLIDCAGSERRHDALYHQKDRQKESAQINASLYALKECIRARANQSSRIPFRSHNLTRILKESFERDGARLCVIACVAPNATDTEHTMETLKTVASIVGIENDIKEEEAHTVTPQTCGTMRPTVVPPKQWSHEQLKKFVERNKLTKVQLSKEHDGKAVMKMSVQQIAVHLFEDRDKEQAQRLFDVLRTANDRVTEKQKQARAEFMQQRRLQQIGKL
ncbi:hypothetical protein ACHAXT_000736 [Thalassiosira profunda]